MPAGVPGGGTSGTPNRLSAETRLASKRLLSSGWIVVLFVSACPDSNISSNGLRLGDSSSCGSSFFFGGSRRRILGFSGWDVEDPAPRGPSQVSLTGVLRVLGRFFGARGRSLFLDLVGEGGGTETGGPIRSAKDKEVVGAVGDGDGRGREGEGWPSGSSVTGIERFGMIGVRFRLRGLEGPATADKGERG